MPLLFALPSGLHVVFFIRSTVPPQMLKPFYVLKQSVSIRGSAGFAGGSRENNGFYSVEHNFHLWIISHLSYIVIKARSFFIIIGYNLSVTS